MAARGSSHCLALRPRSVGMLSLEEQKRSYQQYSSSDPKPRKFHAPGGKETTCWKEAHIDKNSKRQVLLPETKTAGERVAL